MKNLHADIYSEVYSVLQMLGNYYINKIPPQLYIQIKNEKNIEYNPKYNKYKSLSEQKIKRQSIAFISLIHLNFWTQSQEEKDRLYKIFNENEQKRLEKFNKDIFKDSREKLEKSVQNARVGDNMAILKVKENIFSKILNKIKSFFKSY